MPIDLMENNKPVYSTISTLLTYQPEKTYQVFWTLSPTEQNPCFCRYSPDLEYGCVHIEGTDYYVIIGPSFSVPVSDALIHEYIRENAIPAEYREAVAELLCSIPILSHQQFSNHLALLHMSLNGKVMDTSALFKHPEQDVQELKKQQAQKIAANMENNLLHNTYHFEKQLWI